MLTDTLADISGQTDASVARLQAIEKQAEQASELDNIRALRASLGESPQALREAAAQQRSDSAATVKRLRGQITMALKSTPDDPQHPGDAKDPAGKNGVLDLLSEATNDLGIESLLLDMLKHGQQTVKIHHPAILLLKCQVLRDGGHALREHRQL